MSAPTRRQNVEIAAKQLGKKPLVEYGNRIKTQQRTSSLTSCKCLPAARNHDAADVVVLVERPRGVDQILEQRVAEGVEGLRTMEGDDAHSSADDVSIFREASFDEDVVVAFLEGCGAGERPQGDGF